MGGLLVLAGIIYIVYNLVKEAATPTQTGKLTGSDLIKILCPESIYQSNSARGWTKECITIISRVEGFLCYHIICVGTDR